MQDVRLFQEAASSPRPHSNSTAVPVPCTTPSPRTCVSGMHNWSDDAAIALEAGDLLPGTDVEQIGFGLEALAASVSPSRQIYGDERAAEHAKESMLRLLGQPATR